MSAKISLIKYPYDGYTTERDFKNKEEQIAYFNNLKLEGKVLEDVQWDLRHDYFMVGIGDSDTEFEQWSELFRYNMAIIEPEEDEQIYFFKIISVSEQNNNTMRVDIKLNLFQTFMWDYEFDICPVDQSHIDRWDSDGIILNDLLDVQTNTNINVFRVKEIDDYIPIAIINIDETDEYNNTRTYIVPAISEDKKTGKIFYRYRSNFSYEQDTGTRFATPFLFANGRLGIEPSKILSIYMSYISPVEQEISTHLSGGGLTVKGRFRLKTRGGIPPETYQNDVNGKNFNIDSTAYFAYDLGLTDMTDLVMYEYVKKIDIEKENPYKPIDNAVRSNNFEPSLFRDPFYSIFLYLGNNEKVLKMPDIINMYGQGVNLKGKLLDGTINGFNSFKFDSDNITDTEYTFGESVIPCPFFSIKSNNWLEYANIERQINTEAMKDQLISNFVGGMTGGLVNTAMWGTIWGNRTQNPMQTEIGVNNMLGRLGALNVGGVIAGTVLDSVLAPRELKRQEQLQKNKSDVMLSVGSADDIVKQSKSERKSKYWLSLMRIVETKCSEKTLKEFSDFYYYYGYNIQKTIKPNIKSRKLFNFLRTNGCRIKTTLPEIFKQGIESIYNNGIRIYHTEQLRNSEGQEYENIEVSLIG